MPAAPEIETRAEQPYVAIRTQVTMADLGTVVPPLNQEVFAWLGARGVGPGRRAVLEVQRDRYGGKTRGRSGRAGRGGRGRR